MIGSQRRALAMIELSRSSWHYRSSPRPRVADPVPQKARRYPSRIGAAQRAAIQDEILAGWSTGVSVDQSFATMWDTGVMLASRRSWWRIAAAIDDQSARPVAPTRSTNKAPRPAPVLKATGPQQIWSWDITDLRSPWRGVAFKAYSIIDIYSRKIVGWRVEERECDDLAKQMFETAITTYGAPSVVHADSGPAMRSAVLKDLLADSAIAQTHNRPRVSNDNPFSESEFRTMKYRPNYPGIFDDLDTARAWVDTYVSWYNTHHRHSGIALFTPDEVHNGSWTQRWHHRDQALQAYYDAHPERFRARPHVTSPDPVVGINLPAENDPNRLHAA
ncbi:DDE-type integrase/transposase/recombinase [Mycolicibacterium crocinum]|uniref:DDE-type integrase/transposase/recombinase n=1 Tax=Mycolicibacterium crocinum TaxID=388459 RepID=A0ABY3TRE0_9MYCO|nr:DDE-type integrase/transposase/recombinase [Mycolicibacterium crocinum]ULN43377.1 DDE-type integrase/transposase/recombinase [Mycolicibacterium crocinum]ULN43528.1 DDE-type integrase/transposase/recombinase [Mycolicibacterium crocinum]ULN43981.1 DDE-type integrase/transposase/recombinase [Mycolicibacterium crocinum]